MHEEKQTQWVIKMIFLEGGERLFCKSLSRKWSVFHTKTLIFMKHVSFDSLSKSKKFRRPCVCGKYWSIGKSRFTRKFWHPEFYLKKILLDFLIELISVRLWYIRLDWNKLKETMMPNQSVPLQRDTRSMPQWLVMTYFNLSWIFFHPKSLFNLRTTETFE